MASWFNSLHAGIFSMLFVICWFYLILVQTVYLGYQQAALVYKKCGQAPLSTSSPGNPRSLSWYWPIRAGSTRGCQVNSSLKLQVFCPVSHFWKTEQTLDSPRVRTCWTKYFSHFGKFVGIPLLIYSHKATTVQKWGGGTLILFDTCVGSWHFLFKYLNYISFFFFFFWGGGGVQKY